MIRLPRRARWLDAALLAAAVVVLLGLTVAVDPPSGVTVSNSPFTDEAWNVVNARNLVLLGRWSTDDWNLYLVNFPFSLLEAFVFRLAGVGIVQARLVAILATAMTVGGVSFLLRPLVGRAAAAIGGLALGTSALVLYYGRLAYLEPVVSLFLLGGVATALYGGVPEDGASSIPDRRRVLALGALAGLLLGLAIWTKPSAGFAAGGIILGVVGTGLRRRAVREWAAAAAFTLAVGFALWLVLVWRPDPGAISADLRIWASEPIPSSESELARRMTSYLARSDSAIPLTLPLLVAGIAGGLAALARWRSASPARRALLGAALGWAVFGIGALFVVSYRPNRYVVPMLPALAILFALGLAAIRDGLPTLAPGGGVRSRAGMALGTGVLVAAVCIPGLALDAGWMASTPSTLPGIQDRAASTVPAGSAIQGDLAPLFAMRVPGVVLVSRPKDDINGGDLYVSRGVRWVVLDANVRPGWADAHRAEWNARATIFCVPWGSGRPCLIRVP